MLVVGNVFILNEVLLDMFILFYYEMVQVLNYLLVLFFYCDNVFKEGGQIFLVLLNLVY